MRGCDVIRGVGTQVTLHLGCPRAGAVHRAMPQVECALGLERSFHGSTCCSALGAKWATAGLTRALHPLTPCTAPCTAQSHATCPVHRPSAARLKCLDDRRDIRHCLYAFSVAAESPTLCDRDSIGMKTSMQHGGAGRWPLPSAQRHMSLGHTLQPQQWAIWPLHSTVRGRLLLHPLAGLPCHRHPWHWPADGLSGRGPTGGCHCACRARSRHDLAV